MKKLLSIIFAICLGAVASQAQIHDRLSVLAGYECPVSDYSYSNKISLGVAYDLPVYKALVFMPDVRLGWSPSGNGGWFSFDFKADIGVKLPMLFPLTVYTGPSLECIAARKIPDGTGFYDFPKHDVIPKWNVGVGARIWRIPVRVAYSVWLRNDVSKPSQGIEFSAGYTF